MLTTGSPRRCPTVGFVCSSIVCSSTTLLIAVVLVFLLTGPPQARCANTEEFNAYRNAIMHSDPSARAISLELFLKQYPGSGFAFDAQQLLVLAYSETGNVVAALPRAQELLRSHPSDPTALALLADDERQKIEGGAASPDAAQQLQELASAGLRGLRQFSAPASISPFEFQRFKNELTTRLDADLGFAALRLHQFPLAQSYLGAAVTQSPNDFRNLYQLALAYLTAIPPDNARGFAYLAQAAKLAGGTTQQKITEYGRQLAAVRYGSAAAWNRALAGNGNPGVMASTAAGQNASYASSTVQAPVQRSAPAPRPAVASVPRPPISVALGSGSSARSVPRNSTAAASIAPGAAGSTTSPAPEAPTVTRSSTGAASAPSRSSVSIGILADGSILGRRGSPVRQALKRVSADLSGNDEAFLIDFGNGNTFEQDLTGDPTLLDQAFDTSAGTGHVALYDAIVVGAEHLARIARNQRKVLLILADREDSGRGSSVFQAVGAVENVPNLSVYVIAAGNRKLQQLMADFTRRIAGTTFDVEDSTGVSAELTSLTPTILGSAGRAVERAETSSPEPERTETAAGPEGGGIGVVRTSASSATIPVRESYKPLTPYTTLVISGISINSGQQTAALPGGEDVLLQRLLLERLRRQTSFAAVVDGNTSPKYPRPPVVSGRPILLSGEITEFDQNGRMHVRFVFRDASTGQEILTAEDDGEVKGAANDPAGAETEALLRVADALVREVNQNR
jgi:hypothetical protein